MCTTAETKQLYRDIRLNILHENWDILRPGLYKYKHKWHWVSYGDRAHLVKDLSDEHLKNTIKAMRTRHKDEFRLPLEIESIKRKLFKRS